MGLERLAAVLQHVHSNYEIDLFQHLVTAAQKLTGCVDRENKSLRVIADHIRACAFLIVDGVLPSNEGRGYVLRRIIRRALRHGWMLGVRGEFFWKMVAPLVAEMGDAYPDLATAADYVQRVLAGEEQRFSDLLERGMEKIEELLHPRRLAMEFLDEREHWNKNYFLCQRTSDFFLDGYVKQPNGDVGVWVASNPQSALSELREIRLKLHRANELPLFNYARLIFVVQDADADVRTRLQAAVDDDIPKTELLFLTDADVAKYKTLSGGQAFYLYDTYGFPVDLTADVAREHGFSVDFAGFEAKMEQQRERARSASKFESRTQLSAELASALAPTRFLGYETLEATDCTVLAILRDGRAMEELAPGESAAIILDGTPFYAESGGQVGDTGALEHAAGRFIVADTQKFGGQFHGHVGEWQGNAPLRVGDNVFARIDAARRQATVLNHSATHLLHAALRETLGEHVTQKGSLVAPDRLRFDFSHFQPVKPGELRRIEDRVNEQIRRNDPAEIRRMAYDEAIATGAMALFGEKYGDEVRVLRMGDFSTELCGGTHVARTGDIGLFKITSESGVAAGIRRIEAVTGAGATAYVAEQEQRLAEVAGLLASGTGEAADKLRHLLERQRRLERELEVSNARAAGAATGDLATRARDVDGIKLVAARIDGMDAKSLREAVDGLKQKLGDCVVLLASGHDGKVSLVAGVHGAALGKVKAGEVVAHVAKQIGGKGGGRPDMAQGGGVDSPALDRALDGLAGWLANRG
jgi:alanyl-tRNA synthetase